MVCVFLSEGLLTSTDRRHSSVCKTCLEQVYGLFTISESSIGNPLGTSAVYVPVLGQCECFVQYYIPFVYGSFRVSFKINHHGSTTGYVKSGANYVFQNKLRQ